MTEDLTVAQRMSGEPTLEARVRALEEFKSQVEGGRKAIFWVFAAVGGLASFVYYLIGIIHGAPAR